MSEFDKLCNLILEVYGKRMDIPYDGRNAPDRYNNPGGAYPSAKFEPFGLQGYGIIGGGHPIGYYPTVANGVAANIAHLRSMPVVGKTVGEARYYWVNGKMGGRMPLIGMDSNQVITAELLQDPNWLSRWMKSTAAAEGFKGRLDDNTFAQAFDILKNKSSFQPSTQYASTGDSSLPPSSTKEGEPEAGVEGGTPADIELSKLKNYAMGILSGQFDPSKAKEALKQTVGTTLGAIKGATEKSSKLLASSKNTKAVSDDDAFLGKGPWATTDKEEGQIKSFLGEV